MAKEGKKTRSQKVDTQVFVTRYLTGRKEGRSYSEIARSMWPGLEEGRAVHNMRWRIQQLNKQLSAAGYSTLLDVPPAYKLDIASIANLIQEHQGA